MRIRDWSSDVCSADLLRIDRAMTLAAKGRYWEAIDDLNLALAADPRRADALTLRASAYRYVDAPDFALETVQRALAIDRTCVVSGKRVSVRVDSGGRRLLQTKTDDHHTHVLPS